MNTPQTPTVADFEQPDKVREAISVTDLAKSGKSRETGTAAEKTVHFEKKLDEYKKQAAQKGNPTADKQKKSIKRI